MNRELLDKLNELFNNRFCYTYSEDIYFYKSYENMIELLVDENGYYIREYFEEYDEWNLAQTYEVKTFEELVERLKEIIKGW